jgi:hypothetical protein
LPPEGGIPNGSAVTIGPLSCRSSFGGKRHPETRRKRRILASVADPKAVNGKFPTILTAHLFTVGNNFPKVAIFGLIFRNFDCEYPGVIIFQKKP